MKPRVRLSALLLATVLVVGGWLLPVYDAIVFHGPRLAQSGPVRIEASQTSQGHLIQCTLRQEYQRTRVPLPRPPVLLQISTAPLFSPRAPESNSPSSPPHTLQLSRAPPTWTA